MFGLVSLRSVDWRRWLAVNSPEVRKNSTKYGAGMVRNVNVSDNHGVFSQTSSGDN